MYNLSKKELLLIKYLIDSKEYLSSDVLASLIGSNSKTVRDYIGKIALFLENFTIWIESRTGFGYLLRYDDYDEYYTFTMVFRRKYADESYIPFYYSDRIDSIVRILLKEESIRSSDLVDRLFISKTTLNGDMKVVRNIFSKYHIALETRTGTGFYKNGLERHLRVMISDYMYSDEGNINSDEVILMPMVDKSEVERKLRDGLLRYNIHVGVTAYDELIDYIIVSISRYLQGKEVFLNDQETEEIENSDEYQQMRAIVLNIWPEAPQMELDAIVIYLQSRRIYGLDDEINKHNNQELYHLFNKIRTFISGITESAMIMNDELADLIPKIMKSMIIRIQYGYEIRKFPVINEKKINHAFYLANLICYYVSREMKIDIPEIEIAVFARELSYSLNELLKNASVTRKNICVVSSNGKNGAMTYADKLQKDFGSYIKSIKLKEFYEVERNSYNYDLLVTDVSKDRFRLDIPIFQTKFNLGPREHLRVLNLLSDKAGRAESFRSFFDEKLYFADMSFDSSIQLLKNISEIAEKITGISRIKDSVLSREKMVSSEIGNALAVASTMLPVASATKVAIVKLKRPLLWNNEYVSVVFLVILGYSDPPFYTVTGELSTLAIDKTLVHQLLNADSYEETVRILQDCYVNKVMY